MKISFAICTHNEGVYLKNLLTSLERFIASVPMQEYEIVLLDDFSDDYETTEILKRYNHSHHELNGDFATHKNLLIEKCSGDWILNIDADEIIPYNVLYNLHTTIQYNPEIEAYWLPRVNIVHGLTTAHVRQWNWVITALPEYRNMEYIDPESEWYRLLEQYDLIKSVEDGYVTYDQPIVCFPDPQMRLFKNSPDIRWEGKVHERLVGFKNYGMFPLESQWAIQHIKEIKRQETQNSLYEMISTINKE